MAILLPSAGAESIGLLPAFRSGVKKKRRRKAGKSKPRSELRALEQELDEVYARIRERARYEWSLRQGEEKDPAAGSVRVRVSATSAPPPKSKPARRLLLSKQTKPRRKIPRATRHRR